MQQSLTMNLHDDLVCVVIPVFNSEKFLKKSIESILNQTYKNLEIIAVDDGSTDKSLGNLKKIFRQNNYNITNK